MDPNTFTGLDREHFETLIQGVVERQFGLCDGFVNTGTVAHLRENLLAFHAGGYMYPAGVGRKFDYRRNTDIRGDVIRWLEQEEPGPYESLFLSKVEQFIEYLNSTCFTSLNDFEFHYAFYKPNSFYKRHLDQFKSQRGRKYSLILYLNESWTEADGGSLTMYLPSGSSVDILPMAGRAVFFQSDRIEHEVHASIGRPRLSIAGWLKGG